MRALFLCLYAIPMMAGEYAILSNGFRIHATRHTSDGSRVRLETQGGVLEFPASSIVEFEVEEYTPPSPPAAPAIAAQPAPAIPVSKSAHELVELAAIKAELPPAIVHAVARAESNYRQDAISHAGAIGVMQLMPETAAQLNADPTDAVQNTQAGAAYLREMLLRYNGDVAKALAAYNAGPAAVDRYQGVPPYRETVTYVNRVIADYKRLGGQ